MVEDVDGVEKEEEHEAGHGEGPDVAGHAEEAAEQVQQRAETPDHRQPRRQLAIEGHIVVEKTGRAGLN